MWQFHYLFLNLKCYFLYWHIASRSGTRASSNSTTVALPPQAANTTQSSTQNPDRRPTRQSSGQLGQGQPTPEPARRLTRSSSGQSSHQVPDPKKPPVQPRQEIQPISQVMALVAP